MFMQFVAPCFGALLTSLLSTSEVFIVLGSLSSFCLAAVGMRYGKESRPAEPAPGIVPD
jgi:hypothetical protein